MSPQTMAFAQRALIGFVTWLPVISVIITVHEFGHFWMARRFGIAIDRFSLGFGRAILSWRDKAGVEWRVGWIPVGGYVRFSGDDNVASVPDEQDLKALRAEIIATEGAGAEKRYYAFKPVWQRAMVAAAGPAANILLAIVLFAAVLSTYGRDVEPARVDFVFPDGAAAKAGFMAGDRVIAGAGQKIRGFDDLIEIVSPRAHQPTTFTIERGGRRLDLVATPGERTESNPVLGDRRVGSLGISHDGRLGAMERVRYSPPDAVVTATQQTWGIFSTTAYYIGRVVTGRASADQLGGPLRTAQLTGAVATAEARAGSNLPAKVVNVLVGLTNLAAFISVSIGFANLLPIPVLDGGHLLFYAYEAVARRPLAEPVQTASYRVGLALLLGLMLFATTNDLHHSSVFHFLGGLFS